MVEDSGVSYYYASTEEIHSETDNESMNDTIIGLTQLLDLKLVEVKKWGGLQYDNSHIKNSWYQTF